MEQQIQDLVASIKRDGLESAKQESEKILNEAKDQAQKIVNDAKKKAEKMLSDTQNECELRVQSAKASISQAGRDVSIALKAEIEALFERILRDNISSVLKGDSLISVIKALIKDQAGEGVVELNPRDLDEISKLLKSQMAKEMEAGLEIKANPYVKSGFQVKAKDGSYFLDLSSDEISQALMPFLSPNLKEILFSK